MFNTQKHSIKSRVLLMSFVFLSIFTFSLHSMTAFAIDPKDFKAEMDEGIWTMLDYSSSNDILYYDPNSGLACGASGGSDIDFSDVGGDVDKGLNFGKNSKDRPVNIAKMLMADFKFKDFQAAGIVGNFMVEAGVNVWPDINEGGSRGAPKFRGGYGFAQWTGARQVTFIDFAVKHGYMSSKSVKATDGANYAYLKYEMTKTAEKAVVPAIRSSKNVSDAVTTWERVFERAGVPALGARLTNAKSVLNQLNGGSGTVTVGDDASGAECDDAQGGITKGAIFDNVTFPLKVNSKQAVTGRSIFKNGTTERGGHPYIAFDILAPAGTKVVALTDGVVTRKHSSSSLADGVSIYNSDKKLHVYYTHMKVNSSLKEGDKVKPGDELGSLVSVKDYPAVNADHLHIDAGKTKMRDSCSRNNPNGPACHNRVDIGPDLFNAFQKLGGKSDDTKSPKAV